MPVVKAPQKYPNVHRQKQKFLIHLHICYVLIRYIYRVINLKWQKVLSFYTQTINTFKKCKKRLLSKFIDFFYQGSIHGSYQKNTPKAPDAL